MSNFSWTSEQEAAIDFSAKANLLVSAAAGSGKTAVLSERIISRAIAGDLDLSRVLVMTPVSAVCLAGRPKTWPPPIGLDTGVLQQDRYLAGKG